MISFLVVGIVKDWQVIRNDTKTIYKTVDVLRIFKKYGGADC